VRVPRPVRLLGGPADAGQGDRGVRGDRNPNLLRLGPRALVPPDAGAAQGRLDQVLFQGAAGGRRGEFLRGLRPPIFKEV